MRRRTWAQIHLEWINLRECCVSGSCKSTLPSKDLRMYEKEHKTNQQKNEDAETKKRKQ